VAGHIRLLSLLRAFDQRPVKQIEQLHRLAKKNFALNLRQTMGNGWQRLAMTDS